jgi:hypothetical protein
MATYDEFETLVGALKRNMLDAFVFNLCAINNVAIAPIGAEYWGAPIPSLGPVQVPRGVTKITRPDSSGNGGGEVVLWADVALRLAVQLLITKAFNAIRSSVDATVAPWRGLPDPGVIGQTKDACKKVSEHIAITQGGDTIQGTGPIFNDLGSVADKLKLAGMQGKLIAAFEKDFLGRLPALTQGLYSIGVVCGVDAAAEASLWKRARQNVADILESNTRCNIGVFWRGMPSETTLAIAGWAVEAVGEFAPGAGKEVASVMSKGIGLVNDICPEEWRAKKEYFDVFSALDGLAADFEQLNTQIRDSENNINDNLVAGFGAVKDDFSWRDPRQRMFDLELGSIGTLDLKLDPGVCRGIADPGLVDVKADYDALSPLVKEWSLSGKLTRNSSVGIDASKLEKSFAELAWLNYELYANVSSEVGLAAKELAAAADYVERQDDDNKRRLEELGEAATVGSGIDFWNGAGR